MNKLFIPLVIAGSVLVAGPAVAAGSGDAAYDAQFHRYSHWVLGQDVSEHGRATAEQPPGYRTYRATVLGQTIEAAPETPERPGNYDPRDDYERVI